ncbi:MAG: 3-deoxy-manno-octulosonate cytidylyltransferase [Gammaproteobacteria bacterium]|nr:3-deoxy-manno-octulosonate cytidylyltransferase [Gammaproteobacteria bacterium]NND54733.1 3-deoxy-manno-octulosonate cytidylyltransferase [Gammaproteobacteria bacterium]
MSSSFKVVIPARFESSRLPGKVLLQVGDKPMVQHVWERAGASGAAEVVIATDNEQVATVSRGFGADVCMTGTDCQSGTDRVAEVSATRGWSDGDIVVNVQGDAPLLPPASIGTVAGLLDANPDASVATLCTPLRTEGEYGDPNVVKVVADSAGRALYFSRAAIPAAGHGFVAADALPLAHRHLGLYAYRVAALRTLSAAPPCALEQLERLEQLRAMWLGMEIRVAVDETAHGPDVDTAEDLAKVAALLAAGADHG